jgi:hypothetical protein
MSALGYEINVQGLCIVSYRCSGKTNVAKTVLVIGSEVHSAGLDMTSRGRFVCFFGDGAGAACLK